MNDTVYILVSFYVSDGSFCGVEGVYHDKIRAIYAKDAHDAASDLTSCRIYERPVNSETLIGILADRPDSLAYYQGERATEQKIY